LQRVPVIEEVVLEPDLVETLYRFLGKNLPVTMAALKQLASADPKNNPLVHSYVQSIRFACRYPRETGEDSGLEQDFVVGVRSATESERD
jgi:hypothetical protein